MTPQSELRALENLITSGTGLPVKCSALAPTEGNKAYAIHPADHDESESFSIGLMLRWRSVEAVFRPGKFAGELVSVMSRPEADGKALFKAVGAAAAAKGIEIAFTVNGSICSTESDGVWAAPWRSVQLRLRRGQLDVNGGDPSADVAALADIATQTLALVLTLLPVSYEAEEQAEIKGFPEGAKEFVQVNRYERDRRNRAAAIAIHGLDCKGCDTIMQDLYGDAAAGMIHIHHTTPVSKIGEGYVINPVTDLVPLCPNCHGVAHRRDPPYETAEIRAMLQKQRVRKLECTA